jgi:hypothetical protein
MADNMFFSRDTKFFLEIGSAVWEIPILDGYSFSQATNTTEVTLNEMASSSGASRRGRKLFTDSYAPAEWSFSTYARPFASAGSGSGAADSAQKHHAVEEALWGMMVGTGAYSSNTFPGFTATTDQVDIVFTGSNAVTLGTANFYFVLGASGEASKTYKITGCVVNEASVDFDIDGITTINWSGNGSMISEVSAAPSRTIFEKIDNTANFIRNRLTRLAISTADDHLLAEGESADGDSNDQDYVLTLTGGNVTISNNITFLMPETLGVVNQPLGHVTGTRSVGGSFTCYLTNVAEGSAKLFERIIEDTDTITNSFNLGFKVGGTSAPYLQMNMPSCHLEVPTHSIDDVISLEVNFHALGTDIDSSNEIALQYKGL